MQNVIFSSAAECYLVAHICHAGPVKELPEQGRKGKNTHFFKITTPRGPSYCHFSSEESARKARGLLGAMLGTVKPHMFRSKGDCIDVGSIISFGRVLELKNNSEKTFGFPVGIATTSDKNDTIWLTFQAEESAQNVRKALYAAVMSFYSEDGAEPVAESEDGSTLQEEVLMET